LFGWYSFTTLQVTWQDGKPLRKQQVRVAVAAVAADLQSMFCSAPGFNVFHKHCIHATKPLHADQDNSLKLCWMGHRHHHTVDNSGGTDKMTGAPLQATTKKTAAIVKTTTAATDGHL
jgi:hypothetical protein